jgi:2-keto-4-pentenoate hydratase
MDAQSIESAAALLCGARRGEIELRVLPESCRPRTMAEAMAIDARVGALLNETAVGWKISAKPGSEHCWVPLRKGRVFSSPAKIPASLSRLGLVEAEISFRVLHDIPPRRDEYSYDEVVQAIVAMPSIEVLSSNYVDLTAENFREMPQPELFADSMANGAFILGDPVKQWRSLNLDYLRVTLAQGRSVLASRIGGRETINPAMPVLYLANALRSTHGLRAGEIVATGSLTGAHPFQIGEPVRATVEGFGSVEVSVG